MASLLCQKISDAALYFSRAVNGGHSTSDMWIQNSACAKEPDVDHLLVGLVQVGGRRVVDPVGQGRADGPHVVVPGGSEDVVVEGPP